MSKEILSNRIISQTGLVNTEFVESLDRVEVTIEGTATVTISVSSDNQTYWDIGTLTSSGYYVPNAIARKAYVRATATGVTGGLLVTAG